MRRITNGKKGIGRAVLAVCAGLALMPAAYAASAKTVVAVLHFETDGCATYWGPVVARYLMTALAYQGQYKVVPPENIAKITEGAAIGEGEAVTTAAAASLGAKLGAAVVYRGKVSKSGDKYTVTVDYINAATGEVTETKSAKVTGEANLSKAIDRIVGLTS